MVRRLHPAIHLVQSVERMWSENDETAYDRARTVVRALIDAELLPGELYTEIGRDAGHSGAGRRGIGEGNP